MLKKTDSKETKAKTSAKITRRISIEDKVFSLDDLKRIGNIFQQQATEHDTKSTFCIEFSDRTSVEHNDLNLLDQDFMMQPARPIEVNFSFWDFKINRHMIFAITQGDYGNSSASIVGEEAWVNDNFVKLKNAIGSVAPQTFWLRKHPTLLFNIIALGMGCIINFVIGIIFHYLKSRSIIKPSVPDPQITALINSAPIIVFMILWGIRWWLGLIFAFDLRSWLLRLWPKVELSFGPEHLNVEKAQRARLQAFFVLISSCSKRNLV